MRSVIKVLFARKLYPLKTTQLRGLITPDFVETKLTGEHRRYQEPSQLAGPRK